MFASKTKFKKITLCILGLLVNDNCLAKKELANYYSASIGMVNISFAESDSTLAGDEDEEDAPPGSGSASVMSMELSYHVPTSLKKEFFFRTLIPFQPTTGNALILGGAGMNYFINGQSSAVQTDNEDIEIRIMPKFRYYVGGQISFGYLVYNTETAKKSDILMELGAQGGAIYAWNEHWGIKGEAGFGRGIGTKVATTGIRIMLGTTYTF